MKDDYLWDGSGETDPEISVLRFNSPLLRQHFCSP